MIQVTVRYDEATQKEIRSVADALRDELDTDFSERVIIQVAVKIGLQRVLRMPMPELRRLLENDLPAAEARADVTIDDTLRASLRAGLEVLRQATPNELVASFTAPR